MKLDLMAFIKIEIEKPDDMLYFLPSGGYGIDVE